MDLILIDRLIIPLAGMATGVILGTALFRTLRYYIDRRSSGAGGEEMRQELAELRERLDQLEHRADRVDELEERLDFAERLLANQGEGQRSLHGG